jgi:hypothetical protein
MTEGELDSLFQQLLSTLPTDKQRVALLTLQKKLGIRDDDALWSVLVILEHYEKLYEAIPEKIATAASFALQQAQTGLERSAEGVRRRLEDEIADELMDLVERTAVDRAKAARRWATALSALTLSLLVIVVGLAGYGWGRSTGEQSANAAQLWTQLPNGRYAQKLDEHGVIYDLKSCREADGHFAITAKGTVLCETPDRKTRSRGLRQDDLAPE